MSTPLTTPRVAGAVAVALLLLTWWTSGSFLLGVLVVVLVAGVGAAAWLAVSWSGRGARGADVPEAVVGALPTADLAPPSPGQRTRRAVRGLLGRPWVHGDGLVRAAARRLASEDALVWTPRGQLVTAPHLWVELHPDDLADVAARWPLEVLADELLSGYLEHARGTDARRMAARTYLHLLPGADVPVGRVLVTAAFSRPSADPVATASATEPTPSSAASPPPPSPAAGPPGPAAGAIGAIPAPRGPRPAVPGAAGRPGQALLPPPPRPAQARGPAGASRDSVGGFREGAGCTAAVPGGARTTVVQRVGGATVLHRGRTAIHTLVARVRPLEPTPSDPRDGGRPGVPWRGPAGPRRGGGG